MFGEDCDGDGWRNTFQKISGRIKKTVIMLKVSTFCSGIGAAEEALKNIFHILKQKP